MEALFHWLGVCAFTGICTVAGLITGSIFGNIYGGIKGAYRLYAIMLKTHPRDKHFPHFGLIKIGLRAWSGKRYRNGIGHAYNVGSMIVPVDGRDPIPSENGFYGA